MNDSETVADVLAGARAAALVGDTDRARAICRDLWPRLVAPGHGIADFIGALQHGGLTETAEALVRGAALDLRSTGQTQAWEALLGFATSWFPDDPSFAHDHALAASQRGDWVTAADRWGVVRSRWPDGEEGHWRSVQALRASGQLDAAEAVARIGVERFPDHGQLAVERALTVHVRGDWAAVARSWEDVRARFPNREEGFVWAAKALLGLGDLEASEAMIAGALARFPWSASALMDGARVAMRRKDWSTAMARLQQAKALRSPPPGIDNEIGILRIAMQLEQVDGQGDAAPASGAPKPLVPETDDVESAALREMFLRFESLGDNCEFGLVQRNAGVEPLGLLRWVAITPDQLIAGLQTRFAGVGEPENSKLSVHNNEHILVDPRFFHMHTFLYVGQGEPERLHAQMRRRLAFLRDKLLQDLDAGEKIFVYKRNTGKLTDAQIAAIHAAIQAYGPVTLLCVRHPDATHPDRSVKKVANGLLIGHIAELALEPIHVQSPNYHAAWVAVCRAAYRLAREKR